MDEQKVINQIQAHMTERGVSQAELGRLVLPESTSGRQTIYQYLTGKRSLFTGTGRAILDALNLEVIIQPKTVHPETPYVYEPKWLKKQN
jgi:hypothetical protein